MICFNENNAFMSKIDWLLKYCAHFFQKPTENIELVPVLRGESGIGKDTFVEITDKPSYPNISLILKLYKLSFIVAYCLLAPSNITHLKPTPS